MAPGGGTSSMDMDSWIRSLPDAEREKLLHSLARAHPAVLQEQQERMQRPAQLTPRQEPVARVLEPRQMVDLPSPLTRRRVRGQLVSLPAQRPQLPPPPPPGRARRHASLEAQPIGRPPPPTQPLPVALRHSNSPSLNSGSNSPGVSADELGELSSARRVWFGDNSSPRLGRGKPEVASPDAVPAGGLSPDSIRLSAKEEAPAEGAATGPFRTGCSEMAPAGAVPGAVLIEVDSPTALPRSGRSSPWSVRSPSPLRTGLPLWRDVMRISARARASACEAEASVASLPSQHDPGSVLGAESVHETSAVGGRASRRGSCPSSRRSNSPLKRLSCRSSRRDDEPAEEEPADSDARLLEAWGPIPREADVMRLPGVEEALFALGTVAHAAAWFGVAILVMTWPHGVAAQPDGGAPPAAAVAWTTSAELMWGVFSMVGEAMLLVCCAEFLATRRSTALPAAILVWHALTFSVPALLALSHRAGAASDSMLQEWDTLAYERIAVADAAWLTAWLPLMLTLFLLGIIAMRARVRAATEAVRRTGARSGLRDRSSRPAALMERAVRTSDALAAADLCGCLAHTLEVAAPLVLPALPQLHSESPVGGVVVAVGVLFVYYPLLLLFNLRLRTRHARSAGTECATPCAPYGGLFPWAVVLLLAGSMGARLWLCWVLPVSYRLLLGLGLHACSAMATLFMLQCIKHASRSQLRMLHRTLRGGAYHPVPPRLQSVLRQRDAADIEAMLRGCHVKIKGAVMRRKLSRRQRYLARAGRWVAWAHGTRLGGWLARLGANALRLLCLPRACCPDTASRLAAGRRTGGGARTAPAAAGRRSPTKPTRNSAVSVSAALSWRESRATLVGESPCSRKGGLGSSAGASLLQRLSRRVRGYKKTLRGYRVSSLAAADGDEWSVSTATQHAATIQLSPDFSCIMVTTQSGRRAGSSRVLYRGHELMPMRLESATAVSLPDHTPGAISIAFRRAGSTPSFVTILRFNRAADAQPWRALAKLLAAPPEALPRRWRGLYFRSFAASCAAPALGLAVPAELDAFLKRLNIEPQAALSLSAQAGSRAAELVQPLASHATFARVCTLLRPLVTCRILDDHVRALGRLTGADMAADGIPRDAFLRLMRALRRPGPADVRKDTEAADSRRRRWEVEPFDEEDWLPPHTVADGGAQPSGWSVLRRHRAICAEAAAASGAAGFRAGRPDDKWACFGLGEEAILKIISTRGETAGVVDDASPVRGHPPGRAPWSVSTAYGRAAAGPSDRRSVDNPAPAAAPARPVAASPGPSASPRRGRAAGGVELSSPRGGGRRFAQLTEASLAKLSGATGPRLPAGCDVPSPAPSSGLARLQPPTPAGARWRALCASATPGARQPAGGSPSPQPSLGLEQAERGISSSPKVSLWASARKGAGLGGVSAGVGAIRKLRDEPTAHGAAVAGVFGAVTAMQSICSRLRPGHAAGSAHGRDRDSGSSGAHSAHSRARGGANAEAEAEARVAFAAHASRVHGTLRIPRDELLGVVADPELNGAVHPRENRVWQDMKQPLAHYLIFSSHNTYLIGEQVMGVSMATAYSRAIEMGCRCVEIDCWDGGWVDNYEPIVTHGHAACTTIRAREAISAIAACYEALPPAVRTPLILSLEMHCTMPQQVKLAAMFREILGEALVLPTDGQLRSPADLMGRILLKGRVLAANHAAFKSSGYAAPPADLATPPQGPSRSESDPTAHSSRAAPAPTADGPIAESHPPAAGPAAAPAAAAPPPLAHRRVPSCAYVSSDSLESSRAASPDPYWPSRRPPIGPSRTLSSLARAMRAGSVDSLASRVSICESVSSDHTPSHGAVPPDSPRQAEMAEGESSPPGGAGDRLSAAEARGSRCSSVLGAAEASAPVGQESKCARGIRRASQELLGDLSKTIALATSGPVKAACGAGAPGAGARRSCRRLAGGRRSVDEASPVNGAARRQSRAGKALSYLTGGGPASSGSVVLTGVLTVCSQQGEALVAGSFAGRAALAQLRAFDGARPQLWLVAQPPGRAAGRPASARDTTEPSPSHMRPALSESNACDTYAAESESCGLGELQSVSLTMAGRDRRDSADPADAFDEASSTSASQMRLEVSLATQAAPAGKIVNVVYIGDAISGPDGVGTGMARLSAAGAGGATPPASLTRAAASDQVQRLLDFGSRTCMLEAGSADEAALWVRTINDEIWRSDAHFKDLERMHRVSPELSEVTALASRKLAGLPGHPWQPTQMCSVDERAAERLLRQVNHAQLVATNKERLCRVYPKATRVLSDNVDPDLFAMLSAAGFQMIALNLQTQDETTAYATALFGQNGRCGYLLPPPRSDRGLALRIGLVSAIHVPRAGEGRIAEPLPRWYGYVPRLDTKVEAPSATADPSDVYVTMQVIGPGFCCAVHTLSGAADRGSLLGSPRDEGSPAVFRGSTAAAGAPSGHSSSHAAGADGVQLDAEALRPLQRHAWRSSTVLGNGFNAQWGNNRPGPLGDRAAASRPGEGAHVLASRPELTVLRVCVWSASAVRLGANGAGTPREWLEPSTLPAVKDAGQSSDTLLATAAVPLLSLRGGLRALKLTHPRGGEPIELCSLLCQIEIDDETAVPFDALDADGTSHLVGRQRGRAQKGLPLPTSLVRRLMRRTSTTSIVSATPVPAGADDGCSIEDEEVILQSGYI